jgi:hypothetical protein
MKLYADGLFYSLDKKYTPYGIPGQVWKMLEGSELLKVQFLSGTFYLSPTRDANSADAGAAAAAEAMMMMMMKMMLMLMFVKKSSHLKKEKEIFQFYKNISFFPF